MLGWKRKLIKDTKTNALVLYMEDYIFLYDCICFEEDDDELFIAIEDVLHELSILAGDDLTYIPFPIC